MKLFEGLYQTTFLHQLHQEKEEIRVVSYIIFHGYSQNNNIPEKDLHKYTNLTFYKTTSCQNISHFSIFYIKTYIKNKK